MAMPETNNTTATKWTGGPQQFLKSPKIGFAKAPTWARDGIDGARADGRWQDS